MSLSSQLLMIPGWASLFLITLGGVGLSVLGFYWVHQRVPVSVRLVHNEVAGFLFSVVGVMYAVLLAFVILVVWEQFHETRANTQQEASAALSLYRVLDAYADYGQRPDPRPLLGNYLGQVIAEEFPAMAAMRPVELASLPLEQLWKAVGQLTPADVRQQAVHQEMLTGLKELERLRVLRLGDAQDEVPGAIWFALITGGILTVAFAYFLGTENVRAHVLMIGVLAALISVVFFVVIQLDHPFTGMLSIDPDSFRQVAVLVVRS